jgi:hypothetical protein
MLFMAFDWNFYESGLVTKQNPSSMESHKAEKVTLAYYYSKLINRFSAKHKSIDPVFKLVYKIFIQEICNKF